MTFYDECFEAFHKETIEACKKVLADHPQKVLWYKEGKSTFGFLTGMVMRETEGRANPQVAKETLKKLLTEA